MLSIVFGEPVTVVMVGCLCCHLLDNLVKYLRSKMNKNLGITF